MTAELTTTRVCHNCGRSDDRLHEEPFSLTLSNGCARAFARPRTLWSAVLLDAINEAAAAVGVDQEQAWRAVYDEMHHADQRRR